MPDPYRTARTITPGTRAKPGNGYRIACSTAGWVRLLMDDGSPYDVYATVGQGGEDGVAISGVATTAPKLPAAEVVVTVF